MLVHVAVVNMFLFGCFTFACSTSWVDAYTELGYRALLTFLCSFRTCV